MEKNPPYDSTCPYCGKVIDFSLQLSVTPKTLGPGDYAVCGGCFVPSVFREDMKLHSMNQEEAKKFFDNLEEGLREAMLPVFNILNQVGDTKQ